MTDGVPDGQSLVSGAPTAESVYIEKRKQKLAPAVPPNKLLLMS
ncbi:MAG: hypothetical protein AAB890_02640 [Patescibacteria group bacterium]